MAKEPNLSPNRRLAAKTKPQKSAVGGRVLTDAAMNSAKPRNSSKPPPPPPPPPKK